MKLVILQIESQQDGSEADLKRANDALDSGKLEGVEALYISGLLISEHTPPSQDRIKRNSNTRRWAQQKADEHGVPVIMESLGLHNSDKSWYKCSFKFEQNKKPAVFSTTTDFAVTENSVTVFSTHLSQELPTYVLQNNITFIVLHINSKLQGDPKPTEPDFETLRQLLERLEPLITTNYPITILILSCTGTGDNGLRAGSSALLRLEHGKVYVHRIWGFCETKLEVFDTKTTPKQTLIRRRNHLRLVQNACPYFEHDKTNLDRVGLALKELLHPSDSSSDSQVSLWPFDLSQVLEETAIYVISMTRDTRIQVEQKNRRYWSAKLNYLFAPRFKDELVVTIFVELDEIKWLYKILGKQEPALRGVYTNKPGRAIPPKLELFQSINSCDMFVATFPTFVNGTLVVDRMNNFLKESQPPVPIDSSELKRAKESLGQRTRNNHIACTSSPPPSLPQNIVRDPRPAERSRLALGTLGLAKGYHGRSHSEADVEHTSMGKD